MFVAVMLGLKAFRNPDFARAIVEALTMRSGQHAGVGVGILQAIARIPQVAASGGDGRLESPTRVLNLGYQEAAASPLIAMTQLSCSYRCGADVASLRRTISQIVGTSALFYIGVSAYLQRRWHGGRGRRGGGGDIQGHCKTRDNAGLLKWLNIHVVLFLPIGISLVEHDVVAFFRKESIFCDRITNAVGGGWHFNAHWLVFLYVLVSRDSLPVSVPVCAAANDAGSAIVVISDDEVEEQLPRHKRHHTAPVCLDDHHAAPVGLDDHHAAPIGLDDQQAAPVHAAMVVIDDDDDNNL